MNILLTLLLNNKLFTCPGEGGELEVRVCLNHTVGKHITYTLHDVSYMFDYILICLYKVYINLLLHCRISCI